jgi:hypothetical protein
MTEEGRVLDTYNWEDFNLWKDDVFKHPNFQPGEIKELFDYAHEKIRDELGPPIMQGMEIILNHFETLRQSGKRDERTKDRMQLAKSALKGMHIYNTAIVENHPSEKVRERARELDQRFHREVGRGFPLSFIADRYMSAKLRRETEQERPPVVSDPPPRWTYYHTFDDGVWVRKGREAKVKPYRKRTPISRKGKSWLP